MTRTLDTVGVVGSGLLGTSVAIALRRQGVTVWLGDDDPGQRDLALAMSGAQAWDRVPGPALDPAPDLVIACVPPSSTPAVLWDASRLYPDATLTDVASVKVKPLLEAETLGVETSRLVGGHPLAGRESRGALAGRGDLFEGRPWAVCALPGSDPDRVEQVAQLARLLGATPVRLSPPAHDAAVAALSHVPQLLASGLAAMAGQLAPAARELAGPGFADMTRLAASPPLLWAEIAAGNATAVAGALSDVVERLGVVLAALEQGAEQGGRAVAGLVGDGNRARRGFVEKVRSGVPELRWVSVVLRDQPGELVRLLTAAAPVNVEDIRIDHAPHQETGVVELAVLPDVAEMLGQTLREHGWAASLKETQL
jgi:prephenate dehydrogenase